ncbi:glucodextranase DOMON-like domain-containing protein [Deinococcus sp.]|uniref:glucodextranase DOMON-like domain-containing protein n=1 Tax=Deinococcus sp. TaxID=47478 RepID=UPI003CC6AF57
MLALLAVLLLTVPDPAGDARGDGSYVLPTLPPLTPAALDLRELKAESQGGKLRLSVGLGAVQNPWNAPLGYSAGVIDIFVKSRLGGASDLAGLGFVTPPGSGWQYHLRVSGFGSILEFVPDGSSKPQRRDVPLNVQLSGSTLVIDTPIPAGQDSYWVTMSLYSPFTPDGLLRPSSSGGAASLVTPRSATGRGSAPIPVDVISGDEQRRAYTLGVLTPVGQTRDRRTVFLVGLGLLGLLVAVLATALSWRRHP